jgi:LPXTG-motif cell wall-anchored protein
MYKALALSCGLALAREPVLAAATTLGRRVARRGTLRYSRARAEDAAVLAQELLVSPSERRPDAVPPGRAHTEPGGGREDPKERNTMDTNLLLLIVVLVLLFGGGGYYWRRRR